MADLVLSDSYKSFEKIKKIDENVKIILSSGFNEQMVTKNLIGSGLAGFLQKPYTILELQNKIREVLK